MALGITRTGYFKGPNIRYNCMIDQENKSQMPQAETADIDTSSDDYASRFAGPVGEWMLSIQEDITMRMAQESKASSILDVGGGHGQLAIPLCNKGLHVTVLSSDEGCKKRITNIVSSGKCIFKVGNVIALPFPDRAFDTSICFRLLPHCSQWQVLIKELCRTAGKTVIVDYPTTKSINIIAPMLFGAKKKIEKNTREWRMFSSREITEEFKKNGFEPWLVKKQFTLPMALHRALKCTACSRLMEFICRTTGLTRLFGSPVIETFRRSDLL